MVPCDLRIVVEGFGRLLFLPTLIAFLIVSTTRCEHYQERAEYCEAQKNHP